MRTIFTLVVAILVSVATAGDIPLVAPIVVPHAVRVVWDPNSEADLAGYKIYWKIEDREWFVDVGLVTDGFFDVAMVENPGVGMLTVAVTAYDSTGNESSRSDEDRIPVSGDPSGYLFGDLDGSGRVDVVDFALFCESFGSESSMLNYAEKGDLNLDGRIDIYDHLAFTINHGVTR